MDELDAGMLLQVHQRRLSDGLVVFVAQNLISNDNELTEWLNDVKKEKTLLHGYEYIVVTRHSQFFVTTIQKESE